MDVTKAAELFANYKKEIEAINPDLKTEVQEAKKEAIREKYSRDVGITRGALLEEAKRLESNRKTHEDKSWVLAASASVSADKVNPGELALVMSIATLPENILDAIASTTSSPVVKLALLGRANALDSQNPDIHSGGLKQKVLENVTLPTSVIQGLAHQEYQVYSVLYEGADLPGSSGTDKLTYGHAMNDLNKIIAA